MTDLLQENRAAFLHSWIDFNCRTMISSFGALLYFLDTHISKLMLQMPSQHILMLKILNLYAFHSIYVYEGTSRGVIRRSRFRKQRFKVPYERLWSQSMAYHEVNRVKLPVCNCRKYWYCQMSFHNSKTVSVFVLVSCNKKCYV